MNYLIFSDVHGNRFGLEAVLQAAQNAYERVLCLGDIVGYGAHPNQCCEILRRENAICLLGNHDAAALGQIDISWFNPVAKSAILWTREQLNAENRAWLSALSPTYDNAADDFQAVHASLRQPIEEYILNKEIAQATLRLMRRSLCFYGHTHVGDAYRVLDVAGKRYAMEHVAFQRNGQFGREISRGATQKNSQYEALEGVIALENSWRYLVNPGSCGQPRDGEPQARYALFDSVQRRLGIRAVDYDWQSARDAILAAGLPPILGERLERGQ